MKSISLLYPRDSVLNLLQRVLKERQYEVTFLDAKSGVLEALRKRWFSRDYLLHLVVTAPNDKLTTLNLSVTLKTKSPREAVTSESEEQLLVDTIDRYF